MSLPSKTQILVVGGGPAGSYAAAALAREGFEVTLVEASKHPRYHIGESLLPSTKTYLKFIDAVEKINAFGFNPKPGAAVKFTQHKREGYVDFVALDPKNGAWHVIRSEFDNILFRHAAESGASTFEDVKVTDVLFEDDDITRRPIAAKYERKTASGVSETGKIHFDYIVDATGRFGLLSQKYFKNRRMNKSLNNVAYWGYWTGCGRYNAGTIREDAIWSEALEDESGWVWFIPLHDGTVSIGVVQDQMASVAKKRAFRERTGDGSLQAFYAEQLKNAPGVLKWMGKDAKLVEVGKDGGAAVQQTADFSYSATAYAGPGWRLAGDASAFIDPFFSSGVHLAFTGGLASAATIASSIRGDASEEECAKWHHGKVGTSYTRFLLVVLGVYKQIRAQRVDVLSDVSEDNYDRAFDIIRPIIQGNADVGKGLTENEVQRTMDFVKNVFAPTDPALHAEVKARVDPKLFGPGFGPVGEDLDKIVGNDEDAKHVVAKMNAQKAIYVMYDSQRDFGSEPINGYTVRFERGKLGMVPVKV